MHALLSFFAVLQSEVDWLISLFTSANTDTEQAQAVDPTPHDNQSTEHHAAAKDAPVQDAQAADTPSDTVITTHTKDEFPQLLPVQVADDQNDEQRQHHVFDDTSDDGTDAPHGSGSVYAFDVPGASDYSVHSVTPVSFALSSFDAFSAVNHATVGDLSIHPLPSFGGDGDEVFSFKGPSASGGQTNTGPSWTEYVTAAGAHQPGPSSTGLTFFLTFDQSPTYLNGQDSNFIVAVEAVAKHLAGQYDNHVTVSIDVGYGEVDGFKLGSALGESITYYTSAISYSTNGTVLNGYAALQAAYKNVFPNQTPGQDPVLPGSDPLGTSKHIYLVTTAEGSALGVYSSASNPDGWIGLNAKQDFSLTDILGTNGYNGTPANGEYDGIGTIAHEFTEVMGRQTYNGAKWSGTPGYLPLDLFHFASPSTTPPTHIYSGTAAGFFSLDGTWNPDTHLDTATARSFNTKVGDHSDWAPGTTVDNPPDAYDASGGQGSVSPISHVDYLVLEAVGWHPVSTGFAGVWG